MKGYIPQEKIGEIKSRVSIVDLVSEYITLKKAGRNFVGLCPFHKEKTPSFSVNPEKQIFYCFGCGEGGDVFAFLMKINGANFAESARHLANKAGIEIPVRKMTGAERTVASEKEKLNRINAMAADWFSGQLASENGRAARGYLDKRKMGTAIATEFRLGYSPEGWSHLVNYFENKRVPLGLVEKTGLIISKNNGRFYDRFRGRLIFPIEDLSGRVVAFGGRALGDDMPKYLNSSESPVYIKGRVLYGMYRTKDSIRNKDYVIIVEGYVDLLSLRDAGVSNVVATLGTALTREQVELIRRFTRKVAVIFDPDEAGRHAVERSLKLFLEENMHARVVVLPEEYDPDDYVKKFGREALENIIAHSPMMVDYYIEKIMGSRDTLEDNLDAIRESISFISTISDPVERNLFIKRVSEKLGIDQKLLKDKIRKASANYKTATKAASPEKRTEKVDMVELNLIYMMMEYPEKIPVVVRDGILDCFASETLKKLGKAITGEVGDATSLVGDLEDGTVKERLLKLMMEQPFSDKEVAGRVFDDNIKQIRNKWYKGRHNMLKRELIRARDTDDRELSDSLLRERDRLLKEERGLFENGKNNQIG
ncbi:MAG: DNA primase [Deltaproteobacteria bacterium]|nr:DNA primase [Deltaproteobacteria bacterium]MBW2595510.1 DNA primase [Deltaproteobacteria bacterium]